MKNKLNWMVFILVVLVGGYFLITPVKSVDKEPIKIGVILPLTGDLAGPAEDIRFGIDLFAEEHLDAEFIIENDGSEIKRTVSAFKKLTSLDEVDYILGPLGETFSNAIYSSQTDSEKEELLLIAFSMCSEQFRAFENMLCIYPSPYIQLEDAYEYSKLIGKNSVYVIVENDAYGEGVLKITREISEKLGMKVLGEDKVNAMDQEFRTTALKAVNVEPDFIMLATMSMSTNIKILKAIKERGYKGMIMDSVNIEEDTLAEFEGIFEGVYLNGHAKVDYDSEFTRLFNEKKKVLSEDEGEPNLYNAFGYTWANILYSIAKSGVEINASAVIDYVDKYSDELAIKGMKYVRETKEIKLPMKMIQVKNSKFETVFVSGE